MRSLLFGLGLFAALAVPRQSFSLFVGECERLPISYCSTRCGYVSQLEGYVLRAEDVALGEGNPQALFDIVFTQILAAPHLSRVDSDDVRSSLLRLNPEFYGPVFPPDIVLPYEIYVYRCFPDCSGIY